MSSEYPAIPEPTRDVAALLATVMALKEAVEMMTGQRGAAAANLASRLTAVEQVVDFIVASSYARLDNAPFTVTPTVNGNAVWHAGTLEPSTYGGLGSPLWSTTGGATGAGNTVSGALLTPAQTGQWRQMSNNVGGSALFVRVS